MAVKISMIISQRFLGLIDIDNFEQSVKIMENAMSNNLYQRLKSYECKKK